MKKEKIIKTHTRRTKSGKTVTVRQHRAKYDAAEDAKQLAKKIGAGDELETLKKKPKKEDVLSNKELDELDYPIEYVNSVAKALGLTQREAASWLMGDDFSGYKKADMQKGNAAAKKYLGKDVFSKLDTDDADVPLAVLAKLGKKLGGAKFMEVRDLVNAPKSSSKAEKAPKSEVLGVDLSKMSNEDFKEFASGFMDENDKPAPKTRGAFKKWVEKQNWGSEGDANFREGVAEYMKNGGAKGIVSSGKDPITEATRKKGKALLDNIQKSSDQRNSIERPPKTATKPTGVKSPGKTSTSANGVSAEEFKAWYHWDAAGDPKNKTALAVEKKLRAKMGRSEYNKYFDEMTNSYSSRGHLKAYKALEPETAKAIKSNKMVAGTAEAQKEVAKLQGAKKAEKIFAAKEKEAKGNLNKLSGKPTGMYTRDEFLKEMKSGKIPSLAHRAEPKSKPSPDNVSKQVKFKAKEGNNYKMSDGSILTYIGGKKGAHRFKDFKTGKIKFKDSDTIYALSEQKKKLSDKGGEKISPKVVGWKKKNGTEVAKYNTEEKKDSRHQ